MAAKRAMPAEARAFIGCASDFQQARDVTTGPHWGVLLAHFGAWTSYWEALNRVYGPLMLASLKSWGVATPKLSMVKLEDLRHCAGSG